MMKICFSGISIERQEIVDLGRKSGRVSKVFYPLWKVFYPTYGWKHFWNNEDDVRQGDYQNGW